MDGLWIVIGAAVGIISGSLLVFTLLRPRIAQLTETATAAEQRASQVEISLAKADTELKRVPDLQEQIAVQAQEIEELRITKSQLEVDYREIRTRIAEREKNLEERVVIFEQQVQTQFEALSKKALEANSKFFTELATEKFDAKESAISKVLEPLDKKVELYDQKLSEFEEARGKQFGEQKSLLDSLKSELKDQVKSTSDLRNILKGSDSRGRVGEVFLKRLLDEAGLSEGIHYELQRHESSEQGSVRPDCIIKLPGRKALIIDAKTPMRHYEEAIASDDQDIRKAKFRDHAMSVRALINALAKKEYREKVTEDADYVIAYFPFDAALNAAYDADPDLTSYGWDKNVICTTPALLFALLRTVALTWGEEKRAQNIEEICKLGKDMVNRIRVVADHFRKVGSSLDSAVGHYNSATTSLESKLLTTGAKFQSLGIGIDENLISLKEIDKMARDFKKPELHSLPSEDELLALDATTVADGFDFNDETSVAEDEE